MFSENRFDGANSQEVVAPVEKEVALTELELRNREAELKRRYEDPYRKVQANNFRKERNILREQEQKKIETLQANLVSSHAVSDQLTEGELSNFVRSNEYLSGQLHAGEEQRAVLMKKKEERGIFQKLKYSFIKDPLNEALQSLLQVKAKHVAEIEDNRKKIEEVKSRLELNKSTQSERSEVAASESTKDFQEKRADLRERLRGVNQSSREALRNTFLSMEQGNLDIAKLAKENNALVVHAIPLDGWSMKNTSMNNQEIDTESMSAKEKADLLFSKKPDVSASILSAGELVSGQNMFYPFGFILDGKMIASYEGDEGTYAEGDMRRKKEHEGATLAADTQDRFAKFSKIQAKESQGGQYNESIVHNPNPRGILIDEQALSSREDLGDEVTEYYSPDEEDQIRAKFADKIVSTAKGTPTTGPYTGTPVFRIKRTRSPVDKAVEYAKNNHSDLPVYLRRADGIYAIDGKKVTAEEIYS